MSTDYGKYKDDLQTAVDWMQTEGFDTCSYKELAVFRMAENRQGVLVEFMKLTLNGKMYSYTVDGVSAGLLGSDGTPIFDQKGVCWFMPEEYILGVNEELNDTGEDIVISRDGTGKEMCDQIDEVSVPRLRLKEWVPYVDGTIPKINEVREIDKSVLSCMLLLTEVGIGTYELANTAGKNGVVVTPMLVLYNQLTNSLRIADV